MRLEPYRDPGAVKAAAEAIAAVASRPWTLMEVCGGQTHAIVRHGLDQLLPPGIRLLHGPGCPVCVTPTPLIDQAIALARRPGTTLCTFGDMARVPGTGGSLAGAKARGGRVRVIYSPLDALAYARSHPLTQVVLFAVGFETTAPGNAIAVERARREGLDNFSLLMAHVLVPPALEAILGVPGQEVQGFLAAGHVCTVMGYEAYEPIAARHRVPIVVTGFEPLDILQGVYLAVRQLEHGTCRVENQYARAVGRKGNPAARELIARVFEAGPRAWRGIGDIPASGLRLREAYAGFDAARRFDLPSAVPAGSGGECIAGAVLQGRSRPPECPAFAIRCTPESPLGAPMVSAEGACAAYFRHRHPAPAVPGSR